MYNYTGTQIQPISHEERFRQLERPPIMVNDYDISIDKEKEKLNKLTTVEYDGESLSPIPSCLCGKYNKGRYEGKVCEVCGHKVVTVTDQMVSPLLWMAAPFGIEKLIQPASWRRLSKFLKIPKINTLEYLCDPAYRLPNRGPMSQESRRTMDKLVNLNLPRGLNNFYHHFDDIIEALCEGRVVSKQNIPLLRLWVSKYRDRIFTRQIPIPCKLVFVIEKDKNNRRYTDLNMAKCLESIRTITSLEYRIKPPSEQVVNSHTVKAIILMADFYSSFYGDNFMKKGGWFRKQIFGSRLNFTARSVISSKTRPHNYDELTLPWGLSVALLRLHLTSKLLRRGYTPNEAKAKLNRSIRRVDDEISELLTELLEEAPEQALATVFQRNPSLPRGSAQMFKVPEISRDPDSMTIMLSVLATTLFNADFDGDAMNLLMATDNYMREQFSALQTHKSVYDYNRPFKLNDAISLPAPILSTVANWMHSEG